MYLCHNNKILKRDNTGKHNGLLYNIKVSLHFTHISLAEVDVDA